MKTQLKDVVFTYSVYSNPSIPRWVSEVGLEWLYELLSKSDSLWRKAARQS